MMTSATTRFLVLIIVCFAEVNSALLVLLLIKRFSRTLEALTEHMLPLKQAREADERRDGERKNASLIPRNARLLLKIGYD